MCALIWHCRHAPQAVHALPQSPGIVVKQTRMTSRVAMIRDARRVCVRRTISAATCPGTRCVLRRRRERVPTSACVPTVELPIVASQTLWKDPGATTRYVSNVCAYWICFAAMYFGMMCAQSKRKKIVELHALALRWGSTVAPRVRPTPPDVAIPDAKVVCVISIRSAAMCCGMICVSKKHKSTVQQSVRVAHNKKNRSHSNICRRILIRQFDNAYIVSLDKRQCPM